MADPTPCAHERITTASAEGLPSLWYCDECRRRFYPACSVCVDVGHRHETHRQSAPEAGLREAALDVLAYLDADPTQTVVPDGRIAALRAALATPEDPT